MIVAGDITASALFGGNQGTPLGNFQIWVAQGSPSNRQHYISSMDMA